MNWEDRIDNYVRVTRFPRSLFISEDGRVVGTWIMGNDYRGNGYYGCLDAEAPVLTADLRWKPMGNVRPGDRLVGFDEDVVNLNKRTLFPVTVIEVGPVNFPGVNIILEDGRSFVCSANHLWLANGTVPPKGRTVWRCADSLAAGDAIRLICNPWGDPPDIRVAAWLGGIIDGEGHLDTGAGMRLTITQNPGPVQNKIVDALTTLGVPFNTRVRHRANGSIQCETGTTNTETTLRLIGMTGSVRFSERWQGTRLPINSGFLKIAHVAPTLREHQFIGINTESNTFVAYGLASHNSYPAGYLRRIKALFPDKKRVLHLFSGKVDLAALPGDTVDINPDLNPTYVDDAQRLDRVPLEDYDLILADPPYSVEDAERYCTTMVKRNLVMRSLQRVRPGTHIVWLDQVLPMYRKDAFDTEAHIGMVKSTNHRYRVITIFCRHDREA